MSEVQSVIFDKEQWTVPSAIKWLKENDFKKFAVDEKDMSFRFRQRPPKKYTNFITKPTKHGIAFVIGFKEPLVGGKISSEDLNAFIKASYSSSDNDVGNYKKDKSLSNSEVVCFYDFSANHAVVVFRGTEKTLTDWSNNVSYLLGNYESTGRFARAKDMYNKIIAKYGEKNVSLVGHSQSAVITHKLGENAKEIINVNGASLGETSKKNEYNVRSSKDVVSAVKPVVDTVKKAASSAYNYLTGKKSKKEDKPKDITIPAESNNPLTEHSSDILQRAPGIEIGAGKNKGGLKGGALHEKTVKALRDIVRYHYNIDKAKFKGFGTAKKAVLIEMIEKHQLQPPPGTEGITMTIKEKKPRKPRAKKPKTKAETVVYEDGEVPKKRKFKIQEEDEEEERKPKEETVVYEDDEVPKKRKFKIQEEPEEPEPTPPAKAELPPPAPQAKAKLPPPAPSSKDSHQMIIDEWDSPTLPTLLYQLDPKTFDAIQSLIERKNKAEVPVIDTFLLSMTTKYNDDVLNHYGNDAQAVVALFKGIDYLAKNIGAEQYDSLFKDMTQRIPIKSSWMTGKHRELLSKVHTEMRKLTGKGRVKKSSKCHCPAPYTGMGLCKSSFKKR